MSQAKNNILSRLRRAQTMINHDNHKSAFEVTNKSEPSKLTERFITKTMENHAEVIETSSKGWKEAFIKLMSREKVKQCLLGQNLRHQIELSEAISQLNPDIKVSRYNQQYETLKTALFHEIDISLTLAQGAIAETGTLVLVPDQNEPRTMSLIPSIHAVLVRESQISPSMESYLSEAPWNEKKDMPSNILFISSPSKTADIQQTLAYGAHGPKKLIVLLQRGI